MEKRPGRQAHGEDQGNTASRSRNRNHSL